MRRTLTTLAITVGLLFAFTPAAAAGNLLEEYARCTQQFSTSSGPTRICMRVWYQDQGSAVILKKVTLYETNPRTFEPDGWKFQDTWVKCGSTYWFTASGVMTEGATATLMGGGGNNLNCPEGQVTFGGVGVLIELTWPDPRDDFGQPPNHIPID